MRASSVLGACLSVSLCAAAIAGAASTSASAAAPASGPAIVPATTGADGERTLALTLDQCRRLALEKNLTIRASRFDPIISDAAVQVAIAQAFDPTLSGRISGAQSKPPARFVQSIDPKDSSVIIVPRAVPKQQQVVSSVSIDKMLVSGTTVSVGIDNSWSHQSGLNSMNSSVGLTVRQPLLQGFGRDITESSIRIARTNYDISESRLRQTAQTTIRQVETAYWNLVLAIERLDVARLSQQEAQQLLERSRARAAAGAQAVSEVIQAEEAVATAEQEIIAGEAAIRDAEDQLKQLTNLVGEPGGWDLRVMPADTPQVGGVIPSIDTLVARAFRYRPDFYQAQRTLQTRTLTVELRENRLKPRLDAVADLTIADGGPTYRESLDDLPRAEYPSWTARLEFSLPIGNRAAQGDYQQALLAQRQAELGLQAVRLQVYADVRAAARRVNTTRDQINAARVTTQLRQENLQNEEERLRLGLSTNYDVIQFERLLAQARRSFLQARIDHQQALLTLEESTGLLLQARNITID